MAAPTKDVVVRVAYGDLSVQLVAEGAAGNPDVTDDLCRRARDLFKEAVTALVESGYLDNDDEDGDAE